MQVRLNPGMDTFAQRAKTRRLALGLSQDEVAKLSGLKQPDISKIELGRIQKTVGILGLARALQCTPDWLESEAGPMEIQSAITAPMGSIAARGGPSQITTPRGEEQSNVSEMPRRAKVPLISLIQAGELTDVEDLFHPGMATHWVEPRYTTPSEASYALMVEGDSMESPVPGALTFPEGTIVIVDPNGAAGPNSYVIAKDVLTQKATFKKLTTDGVRWFLKPLNPAYATVEIDDPAMRVIGKVVEHQPPGGKL